MERPPLNGQGGLTERLGQGRVCVTASGEVFGAGVKGHRCGGLGNQIARARADDVDAKHPASPRVRQNLHPAFGVAERMGASPLCGQAMVAFRSLYL